MLPVKSLEVHPVLYQVSCLNDDNIPQCSSCTRRILSINLHGKDKHSLRIQNNDVTICELPMTYYIEKVMAKSLSLKHLTALTINNSLLQSFQGKIPVFLDTMFVLIQQIEEYLYMNSAILINAYL